MPDTHINAFHMDVDEAKSKVEAAKAELTAAEVRLKGHPDYKAPEAEKPKSEAKPKKVVRSAGSGKFVAKSEAKKSPKTTVTEKL